MIAGSENLAIRKMRDHDSDYSLMLKWLSNEQVAEHYGGQDQNWTMEKIREKYRRKINDLSYMTPCIIERESRPIGYLQFYETCMDGEPSGNEPQLWLQAGTYNVDMFIGETALWNKGIGSKVLRMTAQYLIQNAIAKIVTIDPKATKDGAIRAYEKADFRKVQLMPEWEKQEGKWHDAWLMQYQLQ